jgi:hypothetical protein
LQRLPDFGVSDMNHQDRLDAIHRMVCICCMSNANLAIMFPTEAHHIVDKGYRRLSGGHQATLPLCPWHHRGVPLEGLGRKATFEIMGPSLALHKKQFKLKYGTERELLEKVDAILNGVTQGETPCSFLLEGLQSQS